MKRIAVLGSTGSVGTSALRLIAERPERFAVAMLAAHRSAAELTAQSLRHRPAAVALAGEPPAGDASLRPLPCALFRGAEGILEALEASRPDLVLNAITGAAGLRASEWTLRRGLPLALANKESLVMAGPYLMELAAQSGAPILPVDSEHCALFQCLRGEDAGKVRRIWLTGSGGPFRERPLESFHRIRPDEALQHPTWQMGPRITIGSATMMNKAFEVLEARWLFGFDEDRIRVVIHPQSVVHSMVEFVDGSMLAQLGLPDMRVPILYCLAYPERVPFDFEPFDPVRCASLTFAEPDPGRYPAIPLAYETLRAGGDSGAVLNAADEVMTELFLADQVDFPSITATVAAVVRAHRPAPIATLDDVLRADRAARAHARAAAGARVSQRGRP
jgi:1-deoxy-D-xylulose-5-phosphate reductoisomerase